MKFLLDQDVYASTLHFLEMLGHDILPVAQIGLSTASDTELLIQAHELRRIFITRDRDFGNLVFLRHFGAGVIYLRLLPSISNSVHQELDRVLALYSEEELNDAFVVIEPGRHRFRKVRHRNQD